MDREGPVFPPPPEGFRWMEKGGVCFLQSVSLAGHSWIDHAFCTRWRGASGGAFAGLNFSVREGDGEDAVRRNWGMLSEAFGIPEDRFITLRQVHGTRLVSLEDRGETVPEGDGLVTARRGFAVGIKTADCVPILIADPDARAVCAVHAGWRGTAMGIAEKAVGVMGQRYASRPEDLSAVIGPSIGPCCYEVDGPVFEALSEQGGSDRVLRPGSREGRWMLDLPLANRIQLERAGMQPGRIFTSGFCTCCRPDLFFSHRRDGAKTGRHLNFILLLQGK